MEIKPKEITKEIVSTIFRDKFPNAELKFGYVTIPVGERLPPEGTTSHQEHEYSYIIKGELIGESAGKPYEIKAGEASYIPAGEPHWCINKGDTPCELVYALLETEQ